MDAQLYAARSDAFELVFGQPVAVGRLGGEFSVVSGSVWLTRHGDLEDHLLTAGQRVRLGTDDGALVERLYRDQASVVAWRPNVGALAHARLAALQVVGAFAWRAARLTDRMTALLDALARRAAAADARC